MDLWVWFILNMLISSSRLMLSLSKDIRIKKRERPRWRFFMFHSIFTHKTPKKRVDSGAKDLTLMTLPSPQVYCTMSNQSMTFD